jgi:RNA polymerase sporulation-specific sigma factor
LSALLSHEETLDLIAQAQSGDECAKETLVIRNTALVKSIVKGYLRRGTEYEDLMQLGSIGLIKAIDGYNAAYGVRFSTYAVPMISGEIKRFLRDDGIIKVSRSLKENAIKIFRAQEALKKKLGREPEMSEISDETGFTREEIVEALDAIREPVSLFEPMYQEKGDSNTLMVDTLKEQADENEEVHIVDKLLLKQLLSELTDRERRIILLRFFRDKTQSEIASAVGVSQVQVSRLIGKTLEKLRNLAEK